MANFNYQQLKVSVVATLALLGIAVVNPASGANSPEELVTKAEVTFKNFQNDPKMKWIRDNIRDAKAVIIAPEILKAGFVVGGSGGRAVLLARDPASGKFTGPAFYEITSASIGFQAGIEKSEVVMLVMTDKALDRLLSSNLQLGGEASIAAGPVGIGAERRITTDVVTFSRAKGIYGGVNLDGTAVNVNHEWNKQYYGQTVTPTDILVRRSVTNPKAEKLLGIIAQAPMQ